MNGRWYMGDNMCSSKKEAEKLAAKKAWEMLGIEDGHGPPPLDDISIPHTSEVHLDEPPSYQEAVNADRNGNLPDRCDDFKQFISNKVGAVGGRIRKISPWSAHEGQYKFEICGSYRYCENIRRHHKKNQIYFIVDTINKTYVQRCHDPECSGFQSARKQMTDGQRTHLHAQDTNPINKCSNCSTGINYRNRSDCERCGEIFCKDCTCECDFCHSTTHCERCFDLCSDCHDS